MQLLPIIKRQIRMQYLLRNTAAALLVLMIPTIAVASSWSPTLLVNTEAFTTIDDGDGSSNIELRFGATGSGLILNVTDNQFEFDTDLEVQGTMSGKIIHAQDSITSSGNLMIKGTSTLSGAVTINDEATFGSGIIINGVTYIFPFGDAAATGKLLASDGAGNLSWTAAGSTPNVFQTLSVSGQSDIVSDAEADTLTFAEGSNVTITTNAGTDTITIAATDTSQATTFTLSGDGGSDQTISHGNTLEVAGGTSITTTASATDTITVDITDDTVDFAELADSLSVDAATTIALGSNNFNIDATSTGEFRIEGTASGTRLHADTALTSSGTLAVYGGVTLRSLTSCTNLTTNSAGVLACNNTDYITEEELNSEAELETQLADVTNVIIEEEINTEAELEAIVGVDFLKGSELNELVDDQVNALLQAGSGIFLEYSDAGGTLTIHTGFSSGAQVSLSPEYAGAVYYGDGANNVGQMVLAYDSTNKENFYKWTSTASSLQDYNISVRVKVPEDFDHWDGSVPLQFRYRTNVASADDNQMDITMLDTAGSSVSLTGGVNFANTSWTTATITGPEAAGTYTPGSYITIIIAMQARTTNTGEAHAGFLNINWHTEP
ncbi:MAG: hypothetical protein QF793_01140 [Candidatus Peribacteraceae bacterium]|nr:hypothetical protein [bacterium]MDP6561508.1 hypothetical protein [Candidatus Peribacteraceae bacterium]